MLVYTALLSLAAISSAVPVAAPFAFHSEGAFSAPKTDFGAAARRYGHPHHGFNGTSPHSGFNGTSFNMTAPYPVCFNGTHLLNSTGHHVHPHLNMTHFNTTHHNRTHHHGFKPCFIPPFNATGFNHTAPQPGPFHMNGTFPSPGFNHSGMEQPHQGGPAHVNVIRAEPAHGPPSPEHGVPEHRMNETDIHAPHNGTHAPHNGTEHNGTLPAHGREPHEFNGTAPTHV